MSGRDQDGVAVDRRVDRGLDGGVAAAADQKEAVAAAVGDLLDAGENVGALPTRRDHLPARLVAAGHRIGVDDGRDVGRGQRAGVGRRIGTTVADERVIAAHAGEDVVAGIAGDDIGVAVAGAVDVAAAGQGQVLDIGAERVADRRLHGVGALAGAFRRHVAGVVDHVGVVVGAADHRVGASAAVEGVVTGTAVERIRARACGDDVGAGAAVDDEAAGRTGVGNQRVAVVVEGHRHRRLGDVVDVAVERIVHRVGDADVGHLHRRTGNILARLAGTDAGRGAVDGAVGNDHGAGIGGRRCTVGRPVVARLHGDGGAAEMRSPGAVGQPDIGHREVVDDDVAVAAVLQVEVDAVAELPGAAAERGVAPLTDFVHRDVGDVRVGQGLGVDALHQQVAETGPVEGDAIGQAVAGQAWIRSLGEEDADQAVRDRAAVDVEVADVGRGALADAGADAGDVDALQHRMVDVVAEAYAGGEFGDVDVLQRGVVGIDGDAVAAGAVRVGRTVRRQVIGDGAGEVAVVAPEGPMQRHLADADEGQACRVDGEVLAVGASGDHDGVAGGGRVDRGLDGGIAAIADQQDVGGPGTVDLLDAGEGVGALGTARGHDEVAGAV